MQNKSNTNIERVIAKISNDFNPDGSDWVPRVGAWVIDCMEQLNVTPTEIKTKEIEIHDRLGNIGGCFDKSEIEVYDVNGCRIKEIEDNCGCSSPSLRAGKYNQVRELTPNTVDTIDNGGKPFYVTADLINSKDLAPRYNVSEHKFANNCTRGYVVSNGHIQTNFDTDKLIIKYKGFKTECSNKYGCELPVIPNNGLLLEAIVYYCMYKMLCRGYNHPVFNLKASQYGTNPYYEYNKIKEEAKRSVINNQVIDDEGLWNSSFYITTFLK